ncbi:MAG: Gfo/Idh/MocA family oxidoreductase [Candidatus Omnitrophica bacterium]|nr:Gfo/Idh/MocA family oxidoreductase [Candidatus Omnitrophota bacterium]
MNDMNIVIIGSGMYVCGRGTEGYGTVVPALLQWAKNNTLGQVYVAARSAKGIKMAKAKIKRLSRDMGINTDFTYLCGKKSGKSAYVKALREVPRPACAIVAVPDNLHTEIAGAAVRAGLHTLVVKPLAPTVKEAKALTALQKKHGVYCAVEFHKRLDLANHALRDAIRKRAIGSPLYFAVEYSQRKNIPYRHFKAWVENTNIFQYLGVHYADIVYFSTGATPLRAMAIGQKGWLVSKGINTYDSIEGVIEWKMPSGKKFVSHILTNWVDPESSSAMSDQKIKVIGTEGRFESDQKKRGITIVTDKNGTEEPNPYFCSAYGEKGEVSYIGYGIDSINTFLSDAALIEEGKLNIKYLEKERPTFRQAIVSTAVVEAVNESLRRNSMWVAIRGI